MLTHPSSLAVLACACALAGCAAPRKGVVIVPVPPHPSSVIVQNTSIEPAPKPSPGDGLRTGDLLGLPKDTEYRATNPALPKAGPSAGTVIVTPPSPPKPKPQE